MKQHIIDTITDIDTEITRLQLIRSGLHDMFGADLPPSLGIERGTVSIDKVAAASRRCPPPRPSRLGGKPSPSGRAARNPERIIAIVAKLPEPFGLTDLAKTAGMLKNSAASSINRMAAKGLVTKVGYGAYKRTGKFPGGTSSADPHNSASTKQDRAALEKRLNDALKQRDHARENGRDTIVEVFQKEIDQLQAQLGQ